MKLNDILRTPDKFNRYCVSTLEVYPHSFKTSINLYWFDTYIDACKFYIKQRKRVIHKKLGIQNKETGNEFIIKNTQWEETFDNEQPHW